MHCAQHELMLLQAHRHKKVGSIFMTAICPNAFSHAILSKAEASDFYKCTIFCCLFPFSNAGDPKSSVRFVPKVFSRFLEALRNSKIPLTTNNSRNS